MFILGLGINILHVIFGRINITNITCYIITYYICNNLLHIIIYDKYYKVVYYFLNSGNIIVSN